MGKLTSRNSFYFAILLICLFIPSNFIIILNLANTNHSFLYNTTEKIDCDLKLSAPLTPAGIRISAVNDSSNSMVITWYTTADASDPKVVYSTDPTLTNNITIIPTSKYIDSGYDTYIYSANLKSLESNTTYYYKVSSDPSNTREILNFTTTPLRNATSSKFLLFGDSRSQSEERSEIVKKIVETFDDIEFSIHTGDIVNDGTDQTLWNSYFLEVSNVR